MQKYTKEQISDITERESKGIEALKALNLTPAAFMQKVLIGNAAGKDIFADQVTPYLQDTKFTTPDEVDLVHESIGKTKAEPTPEPTTGIPTDVNAII